MSDQKSMLCVGGPRAGQRYAVLYGSGFRVPVKTDTSQNDPTHPDWQPNKQVKVEFAEYREDTFHTPQGDVSFWVPSGQTPLKTITMLLETYEQTTRRNDKIKTALQAASRLIIVETWAPIEHEFEKEKRNAAREAVQKLCLEALAELDKATAER